MDETWITPDGGRAAHAADADVAAGWIGFVPGSPPRIHVREGAVPRKAVAALKEALKDLPQDMHVACAWGDGPLGEVLSHLRYAGWSAHSDPDPSVALNAVLVRLRTAEADVPVADWLAAGIAGEPEPDPERFRAAVGGMLSALNRGVAAIRALPAALSPFARAPSPPEALHGMALSAFATMEACQSDLERAWLGLAGAVAGAEGEPGKARPLPEPTGDVLVDLRRAQERLKAAEALGLGRVWSALPKESRMGPALAVARSRAALGRHYLARGRAALDEGRDPRETVSYYVGHECGRHFSMGRWLVDDVEKSWRAMRLAAAAPSGPAP